MEGVGSSPYVSCTRSGMGAFHVPAPLASFGNEKAVAFATTFLVEVRGIEPLTF